MLNQSQNFFCLRECRRPLTKRGISAAVLVLLFGSVSFCEAAFHFVQPAPQTTKVGDGIEVQLLESKRGVRIVRDGKPIHTENMNDGLVSLVLFAKASDDGKNYNIAVRFGNDADLYVAFAVVGDVVYVSQNTETQGEAEETIVLRQLGNPQISSRFVVTSQMLSFFIQNLTNGRCCEV